MKLNFLANRFALRVFFGIALALILFLAFLALNFRIREIRGDLKRDQMKNAFRLKNQLDQAKSNLDQVTTTILKFQEMQQKMVGIAEMGPYFVYASENYQSVIDHWDRVRLAENQIWFHQALSPVVQSNAWDYFGVFLLDPHNNLNPVPPLPYLEIEGEQTKVYTYPNKGKINELNQFSGKSDLLDHMDRQFFDDMLYKAKMGADLYLSIGFEGLLVQSNANGWKKEKEGAVSFLQRDEKLVIQIQKNVVAPLYNWKTQKSDSTQLAKIVAEQHFGRSELEAMQDVWGGGHLAILSDKKVVAASVDLGQHLEDKAETIEANGKGYEVISLNYSQDSSFPLKLLVLYPSDQLQSLLARTYSTIFLTAGIVLMLLFIPLFHFYRKSQSLEPPADSSADTLSVASAETLENKEEALEQKKGVEPEAEKENTEGNVETKGNDFILVEDNGNTWTIPLQDVSHIKVTDHYCTIVFRHENEWQSTMLLKTLRSFEQSHPGVFFYINRSTLINTIWVDKVDWSQRKLIMEGEASHSFSISQSKIDQLKPLLTQS